MMTKKMSNLNQTLSLNMKNKALINFLIFYLNSKSHGYHLMTPNLYKQDHKYQIHQTQS